jgi:hypothetical protein
MTRLFRIESIRDRTDRFGRLVQFSLAAMAFAAVAVWNPVVTPGPKCCMLRQAVGLPCPLCGMTRAVALCVRGQFWEATLFNLLAVPTFLLCIVLCLKWGLEFATGRGLVATPARPWRIALWTLVYIALLGNWAYLLAFRREDDFSQTWLGQALRMYGW